HQHLVGRDGQPVLGAHLRVELARDPGVDLEHPAPRRELVLGERAGGRVLGGNHRNHACCYNYSGADERMNRGWMVTSLRGDVAMATTCYGCDRNYIGPLGPPRLRKE